MDPVQLMLLQWQGFRFRPEQIWELLSLKDHQVYDFLKLKCSKLDRGFQKKLKADYELCRDNSIELIPIWHPRYPKNLKKMSYPPLVISSIGNTHILSEDSISVVGSRKMSYLSELWIEKELSKFISNNKLALVSGGAIGVDQKVHKVCALYGHPSVCWLPSGLLKIYPTQLKKMKKDILQSDGVFVSTYHPNQTMRKHHFIERNQFIASQSLFTFIIEAKRKSGTLITAKSAADLGNPVAVLPSHPALEGGGGLDLLYEGAQLIRDSRDLEELVKECGLSVM